MEKSKNTLENLNEKTVELAVDERIEIIDFGDLQTGDIIVGSQGLTEVTEGFEHHTPKSMYSLETSSGIEFEASGNHLIYVITANNRDLHKLRLSEGKKMGKKLSIDCLNTLKEAATAENDKEVLIADFQDFMEPKSEELTQMLVRVAESIGPISESILYVDDLEKSEAPLYSTAVYNYSKKIFAQQLLSLFNIEKARKHWPLIVGTVTTVEALLSYDLDEIYIPNPVNVTFENAKQTVGEDNEEKK